MSLTQGDAERGIRRCHKACVRCRDKKVRCSGTLPCIRCRRTKETCDFQEVESRVSITRSYLRSLEEQSRGYPASPHQAKTSATTQSSGRALAPARYSLPRPRTPGSAPVGVAPLPKQCDRDHMGSPEPQQTGLTVTATPTFQEWSRTSRPSTEGGSSIDNEFGKNPLIGGEDLFVVGSDGKAWFLGPTSSWSFCRRVLSLIGNRLPGRITPPDPWTLDRLEFTWSPQALDAQPVVDDLPLQDYVLSLAQSVKYHLGTLSPIIDIDVFLMRCHELYRDAEAEAKRSRLWYAQFLLVLAFGEAILNEPCKYPVPGTHYAARAMSLLPIVFRVDKDSVLAIETLCLAALYLQSLDLRLEAFQMIGQALRICTVEGIHRHASAAEVGEYWSRRYNVVFWATYVLDRHLSASVGAPSSISDEDITVGVPSTITDSTWAVALTLHVRLSRLTADILAGVYGVDKSSDNLLNKTQSMLHSIVNLCKEINTFLQTETHGTATNSSKITTRLLLSYHHCIVLTTRPLIMCVLQKRLSHRCTYEALGHGSVRSLIDTCVNSACAILATLRSMSDSDQLDCFIPFQLEEAFSSAFLLRLLAAFVPVSSADRSCIPSAYVVLDKMILKGSHGAKIRKLELERLDRILLSCPQADTGEHAPISEPTAWCGTQGTSQCGPQSFPEEFVTPPSGDLLPLSLFDLQDSFMLSPSGLQDLAGDLDLENFLLEDIDIEYEGLRLF